MPAGNPDNDVSPKRGLKPTAHDGLRWAGWLAIALAAAACSGPRSPSPPPSSEAAVLPLPPPPWRDRSRRAPVSGHLQLSDSARDRVIVAQWTASAGAPATALVLILPGLAQGSAAPPLLAEALAEAGFAVVAVGHPGNDAGVWQGADARRGDFTQAARRMYATAEVAERSADVRFVLDSLERLPPPWLSAGATRRVGVVGIGLGAQTAQALLGESMARSQEPTAEPRLAAAALLGPYVGFEGPAMHQRYGRIVAPLLVVYGQLETDPYGLGMTSQQRRAMVAELRNARVIELKLPTASSNASLTPDSIPPMPAGLSPESGSTTSRSDPQRRGGRDPRSGPPPPSGPARARGPDGGMGAGVPGSSTSANERAARTAVLLSVLAFFEAELAGSVDARDWLEGPHPGPAQWTIYPAGRTASPGTAR